MEYKKQIFPNNYFPPKRDYNDFKDECKSRKKSTSTFGKYCKRLCKQSLITGFPVIASTRSLARKAVKSAVFLVCLSGFLYQTSSFLDMYLAYPTMVDIKIDNPDIVELPAVTICNRNRVRRKALCKMFPTVCLSSYNRSSFCSSYPRYCVSWQSDEDTVLAAPDIMKTVNGNRSFEYAQMLGQRRKDFFRGCAIKTDITKICTNWVDVPTVTREGYPVNCFAIQSLWGQPDADQQKIPVTGQISVVLAMHPEENMNYYEMIQAYISMHDARTRVNPMKDGISLEAGNEYNIYVSKFITVRLPAPYETNCTDYLKLWRDNGGRGPLTGKACAEKCKLEAMMETIGCVAQSISYPNNNTICSNATVFPSPEILEKCSHECSEACVDVSYNLRTEVTKDLASACVKKDDLNCQQKNLFLNFFFNRLEVTMFLHQPKFESVGMFSYIGGYMGMWLGISLVSLFDFVETLFYLLYYPSKKCYNNKRNKRKNTMPIIVYDM